MSTGYYSLHITGLEMPVGIRVNQKVEELSLDLLAKPPAICQDQTLPATSGFQVRHPNPPAILTTQAPLTL